MQITLPMVVVPFFFRFRYPAGHPPRGRFRFSALLSMTLRLAFRNSPPYLIQSKAESRPGQGGESCGPARRVPGPKSGSRSDLARGVRHRAPGQQTLTPISRLIPRLRSRSSLIVSLFIFVFLSFGAKGSDGGEATVSSLRQRMFSSWRTGRATSMRSPQSFPNAIFVVM